MYTTKCVSCARGLASPPETKCPRCLIAHLIPPELLAPAEPLPATTPTPAEPPEAAAAISLRPLLQAIELVVTRARRLHPDLPRVVVALGPGNIGRGEALGWHSPEAWEIGDERHSEILVGAEGLKLGAEEILTTVLHELAHALAKARGVKDTSRKGEYHNATFAELARTLGLQPPDRPSKIGYSTCALTEETAAVYGAELAALRSVITMHRVSYGKGGAGGGGTGATESAKPKRVKAVCACEAPRAFYMTASALELADITCGACGEAFTAEA